MAWILFLLFVALPIAEIAEPPSLFRWRRIIAADALEVLQKENHRTLEAFGYHADGMGERAPAKVPSEP